MTTWAPLRMDLQLRCFANPADDYRRGDAAARRHFGEGFVGLDGEFASRAQDHGADAGGPRCLGERLYQRQDKSKRFSGARLRRGDQVMSSQGRFDGLLLYRELVSVKPCFSRLFFRRADKESSEKFFIQMFRRRIGEPTTGEGRRDAIDFLQL